MLTLEKLREFGADVDSGVARCANNGTLYLRLVGITIQELLSKDLGDALNEDNLDKAFQIAHKLKGGVTNLSLTPISNPLCELTELLRNKTKGDYQALYSTILSKAKELELLSL